MSATNGEKAIVFWRAVSSSGANGAVTTFDQKDTIVYWIYNGSEWGEVQTLYNGTSGSVKGITAAMLDNGTAAVAYTLSTSADITSQEIVYAVVDTAGGEVVRNVQATNDGYLDENPQLAAVKFGDKEHFVLGWYAEQAVASDSARVLDSGSETSSGSETISDIRLLDFDDQGVSGQLLPDSISQAADAYGVSITSDFRFTKNADSIEDLSILWVERAEGTTAALEEGGGTQSENTDLSGLKAEKDALKGVKFYKSGDTVRFTGAIDIAEMPDATLIDHFDAYVSNSGTNEVKAVLLGTTYGADGGTTTRTVTLADGETQAQVTVPKQTSAMYTATETYQDKIEVPALLADYETIYPGSLTQIQFTVENQGIHVIEGLTIQVGNTTTKTDTVILPSQSVQVTADYMVPESGVTDPQYTVTANFTNEGAAGTAKSGSDTAAGTVYLDLPNLQITEAKILNEENGIRTIQVKLNNTLAASLNKANRFVRIGFYSDATCETPIESLTPITISNADALAMIDEGGYSTQVEFNVGEYLKKADSAVQEIPDSGINVYMKAEIVETADGKEMVQGEPTTSDNYASVICESLKERTGQEAILTATLSNEDGKSSVTVDLQNTSLTQTTTGNLVVTLLDEEGKMLAQQQSYTGGSGLITLNGEEKVRKTFTFQEAGADVQVTYSDLILNEPSAELTSLTFSNLPGVTLDSFQYNETTGMYEYTVSTDDLAATTVMASTKSATAKVIVTNAADPFSSNVLGSNAVSQTVDLTIGQINTITVQITDGEKQQTYVLTIRNNGDPDIDWGDGDEDATQVGYSTEVSYAGDAAVIHLHAVDMGDYDLSYQWYTCEETGENCRELEGETANTLTVSTMKDVGAYYYRCKVTRTMLDGSTKDYWSSVATVQIKKATDNGVTLTGTTIAFDGKPHGITAAADKAGSTLYYSTTGEAPWSVTAPTFTAVGVHTVWVYASNPNYEDTKPVSADVLIQENPDTQFKLETCDVADAFESYPQEIQDKYKDAAGLETALKAEAGDMDSEVYDVKLYYRLKDTDSWTEVTADNFPAESIPVTLPYPDGTNRHSYNFTLRHLVTNPMNTNKTLGSVETMDITLEEDGIRFTTDCLSPFVLGWERWYSAELTSLAFSSLPDVTLDKFQYNAETGRYEYTVSADDLTTTTVTAEAKSLMAQVSVAAEAKPFSNEGSGSTVSQAVELIPGKINTITVQVEDGAEKRTYALTIRNNGDPDMNWGDGDEDAAEVGYGTEVYYAGDEAVINLNASVVGDYNLSYQWYACDAEGQTTALLENQTGSTLTIPNDQDAGTYYYRCKVTRTMLDGSTKDYWSSVATVQIKKATDNGVTTADTTVSFDGKPHGITAAADKDGSTLHYSADGGVTWSETAPTFTAVGVYTVWVYASNPNYEDTEKVSATVVIQETAEIDFKLETSDVADVFESYPQEIQDKYKDAAGLESALKTQVTELDIPADNISVYDVQLLYKLKDSSDWVEVTAENFPAENITVKLPYPEGTNRYNYSFTLLHLITDPMNTNKTLGSVETMDITLEEDGIRFTTDCLSPFALGWVRRSSGSTGSTSYSVAVLDTDHGTVSVAPKRAEYGDTVTVKATPDEDYQVETVRVTTSGGREIAVTQKDDNIYTFTMPRSAVSVTVTFAKADHWVNLFTDVSADAWYYDAVGYVSENGLMNGYGTNLFGPNDDLTRSQLAQILYNLEGRPSLEGENLGYPFADVPGDAWFADAVYWARLHGIVTGYSDEQFGAADSLTREQLAVMLWRYAQYKGYDTDTSGSLAAFHDRSKVASWSKDAVTWAVKHGLITGTGDGSLSPQGTATRAQIATILMRFCQNIVK